MFEEVEEGAEEAYEQEKKAGGGRGKNAFSIDIRRSKSGLPVV